MNDISALIWVSWKNEAMSETSIDLGLMEEGSNE